MELLMLYTYNHAQNTSMCISLFVCILEYVPVMNNVTKGLTQDL